MKRAICFFTILLVLISITTNAQQKLNTKGMSYVAMMKPNSIIYHDSVFMGAKQFKPLFERNYDADVMALYQKHQNNKVAGGIASFVGAIVMVVGIKNISSDDHKSLGWALAGGGFATGILGGFLTIKGQENLRMAVSLFNQKNHLASLGIGVSQSNAGLVYKF